MVKKISKAKWFWMSDTRGNIKSIGLIPMKPLRPKKGK